jgi:hypothetical protein
MRAWLQFRKLLRQGIERQCNLSSKVVNKKRRNKKLTVSNPAIKLGAMAKCHGEFNAFSDA